MLDASRVVDVVSQLLDPKRRSRARRREPRRAGAPARSSTPRRSAAPLLPLADARANRAAACASTTCRRPPFVGTRAVEPPLAELVPYIDWQFFFHAWDLKGKFPAILEQPGRAGAVRRRAGAALARSCRARRFAPRGIYGFWPAHCRRRRRRRRRRALLLPAPAGRPRRRSAEPLARRLRRARRRPPGRASPSRSTAPTSSAGPLRRRRTTTTTRSSSRRSPIAWPRRSRSGSTSVRGASGTRPTSISPPTISSARTSAASGLPSAIPRAPTTARSRSSSTCSAPSDRPRADRELRDDCRRPPSAASICTIRRRSTSPSGGSAHDQVDDYAARKGDARGRASSGGSRRICALDAPGRAILRRAGARWAPHRFYADDTEERRRATAPERTETAARSFPPGTISTVTRYRQPAAAVAQRHSALVRRILVVIASSWSARSRSRVAGGVVPLLPPVGRGRQRPHAVGREERRRASTSRSPTRPRSRS